MSLIPFRSIVFGPLPPSFVLDRLDWKTDEYGDERTTQARQRSRREPGDEDGKPERVGESGDESINLIFGEIQVLLAEKRTELLNANTVACSAS
jgi:hypothetical protein